MAIVHFLFLGYRILLFMCSSICTYAVGPVKEMCSCWIHFARAPKRGAFFHVGSVEVAVSKGEQTSRAERENEREQQTHAVLGI
jgi:hypothetical protein